MKYELGVYIPEDGILYSHRRENIKSYMMYTCKFLFVIFIIISKQFIFKINLFWEQFRQINETYRDIYQPNKEEISFVVPVYPMSSWKYKKKVNLSQRANKIHQLHQVFRHRLTVSAHRCWSACVVTAKAYEVKGWNTQRMIFFSVTEYIRMEGNCCREQQFLLFDSRSTHQRGGLYIEKCGPLRRAGKYVCDTWFLLSDKIDEFRVTF
jgi:hypothetical protein